MWQERLKLQEGESLRFDSSHSKGSHGQEDIETYSIVNLKGEIVGSVVLRDHTALNGFGRTISVIQKDTAGNTIVIAECG